MRFVIALALVIVVTVSFVSPTHAQLNPHQPVLDAVAISYGSAHLTWSWLPDDLYIYAGQEIRRAPTEADLQDGNYTVVDDLDVDARSHLDTGLVGSENYFYQVAPYYYLVGNRIFTPSNIDGVTTSEGPAPFPPYALAATTCGSRVDLTWSNQSTIEDGFLVRRATDPDGPYDVIAELAENAGSYSDDDVVLGDEYVYRVTAYRQVSIWRVESTPDQLTVLLPGLEGPQLTSPADGATGVPQPITFRWDESPGAGRYRLQVATDVTFADPLVDLETRIGISNA
ncbi:hypothetical protein GF314_12495 [bacterium]|nr:hypothetical protein [bacterium]